MRDPLDYFPNFLWKIWPHMVGLPVAPTPLQYDFAHYLTDHLAIKQIQEEAGLGYEGARKILMAFRGAAKSYVTTAFGVHILRVDRNQEVLVTSATDGFAGSIASLAFRLITTLDFLADMKPRSDQRQSALAFDVNGAKLGKDCSFTSCSIFGQITGRRATTIIGDDLETPNTSDTETNRNKLRDRVSELGGAVIKPGGDVFLLGTPQEEDSIYKEYAEEKGYELRIYPILYPIPSDDPKKDERRKYGPRLAPFIATALEENPLLAGTSTEPTRFSERDIEKRKMEWGGIEFDRQFKMWLDADAGRGNPLKLRDLICMDIARPIADRPLLLPSEIHWSTLSQHQVQDIEVDSLSGDSYLFGPSKADVWVPAEQIICHIDPSGEGEDETAWSIYAGVGAMVFLLHQDARLEGFADDTLKAIAQDCRAWGVQLIKPEKNYSGGMFSSLLRPHLTLAFGDNAPGIEDELASNQVNKEKRIVETLEPVLTGHRLVVNTEVFRRDYPIDYPHVEKAKRRYYRLSYQLTRMTKVRGALKHDDRADDLAGGVGHFADRLQKTVEGSKAEGRARALDIELEKLIDARRRAGLPLFGLEKEVSQFGRGRGQAPLRRTPSS